MSRFHPSTSSCMSMRIGVERPVTLVSGRCMSKFNKFSQAYRKFWGYELDEPKPPYGHICQIGDPVLRLKAEPVPADKIKTEEIQKVIAAMKAALKRYDLVGIAAPQIGAPYRIVLIEFTATTLQSYNPNIRYIRDMEVCPQQVIINPSITTIDHRTSVFSESCASVRGYSASIKRFNEVRVAGLNEEGEEFSWTTKGCLARIVQHEVDHVDGRLYTDIMEPKSFQCDHWYYINYHRGNYKIPFK